MRRLIESNVLPVEGIITLLKANLQLSSSCQTARKKLLAYLGDNAIFANELSRHFASGEAGIPYVVHPNDPSQVAVLKKIVNALSKAEQAFKALEEINVHEDRMMAMIIKDLVKTGWGSVHDLYDAIQLINNSSADIQAIVGPHIQALLPKLGQASASLEKYTPDSPSEAVAQGLGSAIEMLPSARQNSSESLGQISQLFFGLPEQFEKLRAQIPVNAPGEVPKQITTAAGYREAMKRRADRTTKNFEKLASGAGGIASYVSTLKTLAQHGTELVSTAAPLTAGAYVAAVDVLNQIRHDILPALIVELEQLEEGMALKPGTLVNPAIEQMDTYYKRIAGFVDGIAMAAGALDDTADMTNTAYGTIARRLVGGKKIQPVAKVERVVGLNMLRDEGFEAYTTKRRTERLAQASLESKDTQQLIAANSFFEKIGSLSPTTHRWRLVNATSQVKHELLAHYQKFQEHFAALHPEEDAIIVAALGGADARSAVGYASMALNTITTNEFKSVLACKDSVIESIEQSLAQAAFRRELIVAGAEYHSQTLYVARDKRTQLHIDVLPFKAIPFEMIAEGEQAVAEVIVEGEEAVAENENEDIFEDARDAEELVEEDEDVEDENVVEEDVDIDVVPPRSNEVKSKRLSDKYEDKALAVAVQLHNLNAAKAALNMFSVHINIIRRNLVINRLSNSNDPDTLRALKVAQPNPLISQLSATEKERLRKEYKAFQIYVVESDEADYAIGTINDQLVASLTSDAENQMKLDDLLDMQGEVRGKLDGLIAISEEHLTDYTNLAMQARVDELRETAIEPMGDKVLKRTLFGQLRSLKLSATIDTFIKENTDDLTGKIPYTSTYMDAPAVQLKKNLINALHRMMTTLSTLEALDGKDPGNIVTRGLYMKQLLNVVFDVVAIQTALTEAAQNPGLTALIGAGSNMLKPLQAIPIVGDYLKSVIEPQQARAEEVDIIAAWEAEQAVVKSMREHLPVPIRVAQSNEREVEEVGEDQAAAAAVGETQAIYLRAINTIADYLYDSPQNIRGLLPEGTVQTQQEADMILAKKAGFVGKLSNLSYGPESLGNVLRAVQESLVQLTEIGAQSRRLVLNRVEGLPAVMGGLLFLLTDTAEFNLGLTKQGPISSTLELQFNGFYSSLVEGLPIFDNEKAALVFNGVLELTKSRIANEKARLAQLINTKEEEIDSVQAKISADMGLLARHSNEGYQTRAQQVRFLKDYERLLPILSQIDDKKGIKVYDRGSFLRKLETPDHFAKAAKAILYMKDREISAYITKGVIAARDNEIELCRARIKSLEEHLSTQVVKGEKILQERLASKQLDAFRTKYREKLGPYADLFFDKIQMAFDNQKQTIYRELGANAELNEELGRRITAIRDDIMTAHVDLYGAYEQLNESLTKIGGLIAAEAQIVGDNPCRATKLEKLREKQKRLTQAGLLSIDSTSADVLAQRLVAESFFTKLNKEYNPLIKAYDMLAAMKAYVANQADDEVNEAKTREIEALQAMLNDVTKTPSVRIDEVTQRGLSSECKKILRSDSDGFLMRLVKIFLEFITGWQREDKRKLDLFTGEMQLIRTELDQPPVAEADVDGEVVPAAPPPSPNV